MDILKAQLLALLDSLRVQIPEIPTRAVNMYQLISSVRDSVRCLPPKELDKICGTRVQFVDSLSPIQTMEYISNTSAISELLDDLASELTVAAQGKLESAIICLGIDSSCIAETCEFLFSDCKQNPESNVELGLACTGAPRFSEIWSESMSKKTERLDPGETERFDPYERKKVEQQKKIASNFITPDAGSSADQGLYQRHQQPPLVHFDLEKSETRRNRNREVENLLRSEIRRLDQDTIILRSLRGRLRNNITELAEQSVPYSLGFPDTLFPRDTMR